MLTASLRIQTNPENRSEFKSISDERYVCGFFPGLAMIYARILTDGWVPFDRAFADYVFGSLLLHFFCVNFIN